MAQRKLQMGITIKVTVPTLLTVGLICLAVRVSAQTSNSVNSNLSASEEPVLLRGPVSRYTDEEVIAFRLEEQLFENGNEVKVSLRVLNILQHFVAAPKTSGYSNKSDPPGSLVVDLKFDEPGMHYAAWDKLDGSGNKVAPGVFFVQLTIQSEVATDDLVEETEITVPRRGGIRGFFNKISPGDPFKENILDTLTGVAIQSEVATDDLVEETEITVPRRGGIRGFFNKISPGDPFKENILDMKPMNTYNTVMRIVIN